MVWGKPASGAWASAVEEEEQAHGAIQAPVVAETEFPSLGDALSVKETKKDKKKKQTMSLGEFVGRSSVPSRRVPDDDSFLLNLPTAPRGRVEGEDDTDGKPLGGAFRGYGGDRFNGGGGGRGGRFGDSESGGRPRRERDGGEEEDTGPSRADMADDWGAERKFVPGGPSSGDGDRFGSDRGFGSNFNRPHRDHHRGDDGGRPPQREYEPSRAETGDWGAKQFKPSSPRPSATAGFRDSIKEPSRADTESRWERRGGGDDDVKSIGFEDRPRRTYDDDGGAPHHHRQQQRRGGGGFAENWRGRDRDIAGGSGSSRDASREDVSTWRKEVPPSQSGSIGEEEAPRERPKLVLKPRSVAPKQEGEVEREEDVSAAVNAERPSVFGAARPREAVLKEQGRDAVKEDLKLEQKEKRRERRPRKESEEESILKGKIEDAKKELETAEDKESVESEIARLEDELKKLSLPNEERKGGHRGRDTNGRGDARGRRDDGGRRRKSRDDGGGGGAGAGAPPGLSKGDRW